MRERKDYRLGLTAILLALIMAFISITTVTSIRTGIGFGRDLRTIVTTKYPEQLDVFLDMQSRSNREWQVQRIDVDTYVIHISGVESADDFRESLHDNVIDIKVKHIGTFGSVTKLMNNQSFISLYLCAFIAVVFAYLGYRYRLFGILTAFQITSSMMIALMTLVILNNPFTKTLWYTIILVFIIAIFQKQNMLTQLIGVSLKDHDSRKDSIKQSLINLSYFVLLGGLMMLFFNFDFTINGWFVFLFGGSLFAHDMVMIFWGRDLLVDNDPGEGYLDFKEVSFFGTPVKPHRMYANIILLLVTAVVLSGLSVMNTSVHFAKSSDFAKQNVLMIPRSDSNTYLEAQAMLSSIGMFDKQLDYAVSDQGYIWIRFDETVTGTDLKIARDTILESTGHESSYYYTSGRAFPLFDYQFYLTFFAILVICLVFIRTKLPYDSILPIVVVSVMTAILYLVFSIVFQLKWSREMIFMTWSIPLIIANYYASSVRLQSFEDTLSFQQQYVKTFVIMASIFMIIASPILIVVPITLGVELVVNFIVLFLSLAVGILASYGILHLFRKTGKTDESTPSNL
ncbi:hypothetical protein G7062_08685 [Erysipelothrix sp. HDW6C]|uniref:hypothetical protein n=1 Tax=Erysipelothrix sp. HDW6C TaxID=2714930 RepID=UPI00140B7C8B|nr:hypothetical protein [Erysipelothrix sp. HDW6C]QIK70369.1 hypothetical protein G7062_08685 [Erysipelothrix sp. HDW6C]